MSTPPWPKKILPANIWRKTSGSLQRLAIWVLILTIWEAAYRIHPWHSYVFPYPTQVLDSLLDMLNIRSGLHESLHAGWPAASSTQRPAFHPGFIPSVLFQGLVISGGRLLSGFAFSILLGGLLGALMWRFKSLNEFFGPMFLGLQTLPSVCWIPMAITLFGLQERAIQFVLIMGSFFAIAISLRDGLRTIPPLYQRAGLMLGAGGWKLYAYVLLPAALPALCSGLRQGFSFAWRSLMGAEFVFQYTRFHGIGNLLKDKEDDNNAAAMVGLMIVMVVIGMLADRLIFGQLEKRISHRFGLSGAK